MAIPRTRKRRRRWASPDTWDTANAKDFRRLNRPTYPVQQVFNPNVRLDPSQVIDNRGSNLVRDIWQWFTNQPILRNSIPNRTGPKVDFPKDTGFGRMQQRVREYDQARAPRPLPGPAPTPSRITNPGLLSKYRR